MTIEQELPEVNTIVLSEEDRALAKEKAAELLDIERTALQRKMYANVRADMQSQIDGLAWAIRGAKTKTKKDFYNKTLKVVRDELAYFDYVMQTQVV